MERTKTFNRYGNAWVDTETNGPLLCHTGLTKWFPGTGNATRIEMVASSKYEVGGLRVKLVGEWRRRDVYRSAAPVLRVYGYQQKYVIVYLSFWGWLRKLCKASDKDNLWLSVYMLE